MFNGFQANNSNGINVNTKLYSSYSETALVTLGAWNDKLSLKIAPFKGVNADGIRQYAQDNTEIVSTSLNVDNTTALLKGIEEVIIPALKNKTAQSVSVTTTASNGTKKVITIATDGENTTLSAAINVNEQGQALPNNVITHTFNKRSYIVGYKATEGGGTEVIVNTDFENFVKKLSEIYNFAPVVPHAMSYSNAVKAAYSNKKANAMNNAQPQYTAPVSNYAGNSMADFLPFN